MRASQLLSTTLREVPHDVESGNQELLVRAGYVRQMLAGVYSFLPLGTRVLHKIERIIREEMNRVGSQEVLMSILQPRELWDARSSERSLTRAEGFGEELFALKDRKGRELTLGPTHEEMVTLLAREFIRSYRDLPRRIYQIQDKFRDQLRPRGGLLRTREFLMKDLYSFDADEAGLESSYRAMTDAYHAIFTRCGVRYIVVQADSGAIGGKDSQEFMALTGAGEDIALVCDRCNYAANIEKAEFVRSELAPEPEADLQEVYTPNCMTISELAAFLHIAESKTMKSVCYSAGGRIILVVVRGDLEVNEVKLQHVLRQAGVHTADLHLATPEELAAASIIAGYTSPVGKGQDVLVVADSSLRQGNNYVTGANRADYHLINVNYPRDFRVDAWGDIASAYDGAICVQCGGTLHTTRGSELAHMFKPGTMYSTLFDATYLDVDGVARPIFMGSYGIGLSRLMAVVVEQFYDEHGLVWPFTIAPYHVALVGLDLEKGETGPIVERLYAELTAAGVEVLFDDRQESAGVKFNDADLLGLPLRVVVSKRSLKNGGVELKWRNQQNSQIVALAEVVTVIQSIVRAELQRAGMRG